MVAQEASKQPLDTDFRQQRLKAWQPILTPRWVIGTFFFVGILFPILGGILLAASNSVQEYETCYTTACPVGTTGCTVSINVAEDMQAPVYFYYRLTKLYQNHRRYVSSKSDDQLAGVSGADTGDCDPLEKSNVEGLTNLNLYPCGLIAGSYFGDTFDLSLGSNKVAWTGSGIAWQTDIDTKFKARALASGETNIVSQSGRNQTLPEVSDEEFIVWMRTAGLPNFRKLNRIINTDLVAGTYTVTINSTFDVSVFGGDKCVLLSTTSWLGGKNTFLGGAYIFVGILCLLFGIGFTIASFVCPRREQDSTYFKHTKIDDSEMKVRS